MKHKSSRTRASGEGWSAASGRGVRRTDRAAANAAGAEAAAPPARRAAALHRASAATLSASGARARSMRPISAAGRGGERW